MGAKDLKVQKKRGLDTKQPEKKTVKKQKVEKKTKKEEGSGEESSDIESSENEEEDELDQLDDEERDEGENEDEDEDMEDGEDAEKKKSDRAEQKRILKERKLSRPMGEKIQHIKQVWEKLRVKKDTPGPVREKLVNQMWALIKDNIKELVFKHDSSRVVQTVFKYSDKDKRLEITKALQGSFVDLAKSPYGKFLLVKIMHYGSQRTRAEIINELHGNFAKLMKHKEGAYLVEDIYRDYSTSAQKKQIMREFYGNEYALFKEQDINRSLTEILEQTPDKRNVIMRNLNRIITSSVEKGSIGFQLVHAAMLEYIKNINSDEERESFVDLVAEQFPEMVHTPEGSQVACRVLAMATAKERKQLVRSLKQFATKCAEDENGYLVLISLFMTVDDTKLVAKTITSDLSENMLTLIKSKFGRRPLLYLLVGKSPRYFDKHVLEKFDIIDNLKEKTSKKDDEARRLELNTAIAPHMLDTISKNTNELMNDNLGLQFISEALLYSHGVDRTLAMEAVLDSLRGDVDQESHPLSQKFTSRALRTLVQGGVWNGKLKQVDKSPESDLHFASKLAPIVIENIAGWSSGSGSFAVVSLLEHNQSKKEMKKALLPLKSKLPTDVNKGSKLIAELLG